jgi:hypothetical protein
MLKRSSIREPKVKAQYVKAEEELLNFYWEMHGSLRDKYP